MKFLLPVLSFIVSTEAKPSDRPSPRNANIVRKTVDACAPANYADCGSFSNLAYSNSYTEYHTLEAPEGHVISVKFVSLDVEPMTQVAGLLGTACYDQVSIWEGHHSETMQVHEDGRIYCGFTVSESTLSSVGWLPFSHSNKVTVKFQADPIEGGFGGWTMKWKIAKIVDVVDIPFSQPLGMKTLLLQVTAIDAASFHEHGCHCSKFSTVGHKNSNFIADELDAVCYSWFKSRRCLDLQRLVTETVVEDSVCEDVDDSSYQIRQLDFGGWSCHGDNSACQNAICKVDLHFAETLKTEFNNWSSSDNVTCKEHAGNRPAYGIRPKKREVCVGTAPRLNVVSFEEF